MELSCTKSKLCKLPMSWQGFQLDKQIYLRRAVSKKKREVLEQQQSAFRKGRDVERTFQNN